MPQAGTVRRRALITGASAGIGTAFAREFARQGYDLVLTARRAERLEALAGELRAEHGIDVLTVPLDLADPSAPAVLQALLNERGVEVDALVNNAGYGQNGLFETCTAEANRDFLQVLLVSHVELAHRFLPGMRQRGFGRIINVASIAGFLPGGPDGGLYRPAKTFMVRFSEMLWSPGSNAKVRVTALCPGYVLSEFHDHLPLGSRRPARSGIVWLSPDAVARAGYRAVERNRPILVIGWAYKVVAALAWLLPGRLLRALEKRA